MYSFSSIYQDRYIMEEFVEKFKEDMAEYYRTDPDKIIIK